MRNAAPTAAPAAVRAEAGSPGVPRAATRIVHGGASVVQRSASPRGGAAGPAGPLLESPRPHGRDRHPVRRRHPRALPPGEGRHHHRPFAGERHLPARPVAVPPPRRDPPPGRGLHHRRPRQQERDAAHRPAGAGRDPPAAWRRDHPGRAHPHLHGGGGRRRGERAGARGHPGLLRPGALGHQHQARHRSPGHGPPEPRAGRGEQGHERAARPQAPVGAVRAHPRPALRGRLRGARGDPAARGGLGPAQHQGLAQPRRTVDHPREPGHLAQGADREGLPPASPRPGGQGVQPLRVDPLLRHPLRDVRAPVVQRVRGRDGRGHRSRLPRHPGEVAQLRGGRPAHPDRARQRGRGQDREHAAARGDAGEAPPGSRHPPGRRDPAGPPAQDRPRRGGIRPRGHEHPLPHRGGRLLRLRLHERAPAHGPGRRGRERA